MMWSKLRMLAGVGLTVGTGIGIINYRKEVAYAAQAMPTHKPYRPSQYESNYSSWDENWDFRADQCKSETGVETKKPQVVRHLILIRHGQYNLQGKSDPERMLTALGRLQAKGVGERLKELNLPYTVMINSSMTRAKETANIISETLGGCVPRREHKMLEEGAPAMPEPKITSHRNGYQLKVFRDGARIEAAFRDLFHRPDPNMTEDSYEIVVCHANVIRYFVCRALQFPPEGWLRFSLKHCSITWFTIKSSGHVSVRTIGDSGFFSPEKLTTC